jgi:hypothetical protein
MPCLARYHAQVAPAGPAPTMATSLRESVMGVVLSEWGEGINDGLSATASAVVSSRVPHFVRLWHPPGP